MIRADKPTANQDDHRISKRVIAVSTLLMLAGAIALALPQAPPEIFSLTWRWYALAVMVAIAVNIAVLVVLLTKSSYRKGSFYWFIGFNICDIIYLCLVLAFALNATPVGSAFWQGLWPMAWVPISFCLVFFVFSYIDDTDMPKNLLMWSSMLISVAVLEGLAGGTNLIESHVPNQTKLEWFGYQSAPGDVESLVFLWIFAMMITVMVALIKAYRRAVSRVAKRQLLIFIIAIGQYMAMALIFDLFIYSIAPDALPPMSFVHFTLLSYLIGFGIFRYGLFQITPTSLAVPILENLSEAVLGVNKDFQIEFANQGAAAIFGEEKTLLQGLTFKDLFRAKDYPVIQRGILDGNGVYSIEGITIKTLADERTVPVIVGVSPARNEHGESVGYIVVVQNVTELKRKSVELAREKASVERKVVERTKELHEERARLRASIESLGLGFLLVDTDHKPVIQNRALQRILGMTGPAASLSELSGLMTGYDLEAECRRSQKQGQAVAAREVVAGSRIMRVFMTPVELEGGEVPIVLGSVVLIEDITEAKVLERSRDEFFSIASHELRTPLTAIRGNTSMMLDYYPEEMKNPELAAMMHDVHDASTGLIAIVNDFLDMSRLEQGKMAFEPVAFAIEPLIEKVAYEIKVVLEEKKLGLVFNTMELNALPPVWGDKVRVQQVIYNLVGNAAKFTEKGQITIHSEVSGEYLKVAVSDTGRGISTAARKLLFHKFQQAGESLLTRDTTRGTGLGLYISRLLVENMGGELQLESSKVGAGSTFSFTLPIKGSDRAKAEPAGHMEVIDTKTGLAVASKPVV